LAGVQQELLARVRAAVKPGGRLIYAVCTLTKAETTEVAEAFTERFPEFAPLTLANPFQADWSGSRLWFLPQDTGGSGMFVAGWKRALGPR
jgi:16S rRNA (cytosine967-C5)-methyltransferase